jgi:predicted metalloenzyme YecM
LILSKTWVEQIEQWTLAVNTISVATDSPQQGHNKWEPTTLILPYGSNKHHCMDMEEFHWLCGVMQGRFLSKTWVEKQ